ncbi:MULTISPECIES: type II toxin-antitoxin system VapC family toxin [Metallosphaera]|uniref:PilT protein domain protein n=3 Tax=Metallosphaera TaxID=41980 RepID=A4YGB3_METS5|nr:MULTISPECIES: type II toxin-antitoxin system VapC family toxin [Metallosphaera]ABP95465.1 PilT protein domain protein [Metallosphaera sedula DSM 5348]AIM27450.1 PilT protein domain protein [Metallosphaera sedula]AKV74324.1 twitching motility protein PilT [Metallosphaera sedula]AKV76563.1 twitching motility protein PilT [Metallosphaera sedula]AKV78815.1 twitching motility protein PilT [Metallosphaera sedula]
MIFLDANFLVYLNLGVDPVKSFYLRILSNESMGVDPLVLDEVIYVSRKKYGVNFGDTLRFLDELVLPYVVVFPISLREYQVSKELITRYSLYPSDAFHVAVMLNNSIKKILTEDSDFEKIKEIERIWIK